MMIKQTCAVGMFVCFSLVTHCIGERPAFAYVSDPNVDCEAIIADIGWDLSDSVDRFGYCSAIPPNTVVTVEDIDAKLTTPTTDGMKFLVADESPIHSRKIVENAIKQHNSYSQSSTNFIYSTENAMVGDVGAFLISEDRKPLSYFISFPDQLQNSDYISIWRAELSFSRGHCHARIFGYTDTRRGDSEDPTSFQYYHQFEDRDPNGHPLPVGKIINKHPGFDHGKTALLELLLKEGAKLDSIMASRCQGASTTESTSEEPPEKLQKTAAVLGQFTYSESECQRQMLPKENANAEEFFINSFAGELINNGGVRIAAGKEVQEKLQAFKKDETAPVPAYVINGAIRVICCDKEGKKQTIFFDTAITNMRTNAVVGETHTERQCEERITNKKVIGPEPSLWERLFKDVAREVTYDDLFDAVMIEGAKAAAEKLKEIDPLILK